MQSLKKEIRITINNLTVSYYDEGPDDAPVVIFIHGFPFNKSMWNKQVEALKDDYRVIAYDVRGHGNSDAGNDDFTIDLFVSDLLRFMDELGIVKTVLCGLSMGGYITLNAVEKHPWRFEALILSDTNCIADSTESKEKRITAIENIRENGVEKYADDSIKNLFAPESFIAKKVEIAAAREMIVNTSKNSLYRTLLALSGRKETCTELSEIKVPVLIMVGEKDTITPPAAARLMHEKIKGSILHIIGQAGHLSNMENPLEFNGQLKKFLTSVYSKKIKPAGKMENHSKSETTFNPEPGKHQPKPKGQNRGETLSYEDADKDLNSKILKITMTIMDQYPELSKYIEEMPVTIPNEKNPDVTLSNLKTYYESLSLMLNKYKTEHPSIEN